MEIEEFSLFVPHLALIPETRCLELGVRMFYNIRDIIMEEKVESASWSAASH